MGLACGRWGGVDAGPVRPARRRVLTSLGLAARALARRDPWTDVYGLARTLLALGTASTLVASSTETLFRPVLGGTSVPHCAGPATLGLFCLAPTAFVPWAHLAAIGVLAVVASGWRPRVTAIPHWWVSASFAASAAIPDGGDHVTAMLTLLVLPVALTDDRRWHWGRRAPEDDETWARLIAWSGAFVVRLQVAGIYLHASLGKLGSAEWVDGTALFYWFSDPSFGAPLWLRPFAMAVASTSLGAIVLSWGTIALEFALALALVIDRRWWRPLLLLGVGFHLSIALLMGLPSFTLAMSAALLIYLRAFDAPWDLHLLRMRLRPVRWRPRFADASLMD